MPQTSDPSPKLRRRKSALEAQERESRTAERMTARRRAESRARREQSGEASSERGMEIKPSTSSRAPSPPPARGTKRKADAEVKDEPSTRYSPPPVDNDASEETLDEFAAALGRDSLVARLLWRGLEGAERSPATMWAGVQEYTLFARRQGDEAPFFPAKRVPEYIANKAIEEYRKTGIVDHGVLDKAERTVRAFHDVLHLPYDEHERVVTSFVTRGALEAWGEDGCSKVAR